MKEFKYLTEDFFIGNLGSIESTDEVFNAVASAKYFNEREYLDATVGYKDAMRKEYKTRRCNLKWLSVDNVNFIEKGLREIIKHVNNSSWNLYLENKWETHIQYTKYAGKGHFYDWHRDYYAPEEYEGIKDIPMRRVSIVYSLSHKTDYVGGEFQIKTSNGETYTRKFDYGDFIVFPSTKIHRVKKLKGGERVTLVGWYY